MGLGTTWLVVGLMMASAAAVFVKGALHPTEDYAPLAASFAFLAALALFRVFKLTSVDTADSRASSQRFGANGVVVDTMTDKMRKAYDDPFGSPEIREPQPGERIGAAASFLLAIGIGVALPPGWQGTPLLYAAVFASVGLSVIDWLRTQKDRKPSSRVAWAAQDTIGRTVTLYRWAALTALGAIQVRYLLDRLA